MDPDALHDEVDEWVHDGIISESQAEEILARYDDEDPRRSRVVLALSLVGAALVFVGVTLFLATNWNDLSCVARTAVLIAGPGLAYASGVAAYGRDAARIGHALCILGALLVGPSVFLLDDLYTLASEEWLLFAWTAIALPTGHALGSRVGTGFGLLALVALVVELVEPADPFLAVGLFGVVVLAFGHYRGANRAGRIDERVAWTYRVGGAALAMGALLAMTQLESRFGRFTVEPGVVLFAVMTGALLGAGWLFYTDERAGSGWSVAILLALAVSTVVAALAPETVPESVAFVGVHAAALGSLLATGYLGYLTRSRALIDLAAIGGLIQTLSFVAATVVDELSGSIALVVAGLVLLAAGVALERGRRSLLARL